MHTFLPSSAHAYTNALVRRFLIPEDLSPDQPIHQQAFVDALRVDPTLPIPPDLLTALTDHQLWQLTKQPAAVRELLLRLSTPGRRTEGPTIHHETDYHELAPALEQAIVTASRERRLASRSVVNLVRTFPLSGPTRAILAHL